MRYSCATGLHGAVPGALEMIGGFCGADRLCLFVPVGLARGPEDTKSRAWGADRGTQIAWSFLKPTLNGRVQLHAKLSRTTEQATTVCC
ncbi:hypothetical protein AAFF_G00399260 [Aldrovandia affinis]|uniref:Uncharacterized protein n=1 Tax=Aldrovandia affinis TaxID=143900 RepID=A0AAD7SCU1_9TELE|nr:hypothetical protein AAFF_G00399260 [Aldrovandia affinis]